MNSEMTCYIRLQLVRLSILLGQGLEIVGPVPHTIRKEEGTAFPLLGSVLSFYMGASFDSTFYMGASFDSTFYMGASFDSTFYMGASFDSISDCKLRNEQTAQSSPNRIVN